MSQPDPSPDSSTRSRKPAGSPLPDSFAPARRSSDASSSRLDSETRDLLHRRFRAASLILAIGFGVFLLRDLYFGHAPRAVGYLHGLVFLLLLGNVLALSSRWTPSMRQLRAMELSTFAVVAVFFMTSESLGFQVRLSQARLDVNELRVLFKRSIIGTLILVFTYGIFIPNHWKRAACVIVPMTLAPWRRPWS